ncbi:MAG: hypothetical protein GY943_05330 [Chloroflexi bacterium]|nr:hypothetical protein [Chloroflexota bacterium]
MSRSQLHFIGLIVTIVAACWFSYDQLHDDGTAVTHAACPPTLSFTHVPAYGQTDPLEGIVTCANASTHQLVTYIFVGAGWWVKPTFANPITIIKPDGSWLTNVNTGTFDKTATMIMTFLVPISYTPPLMGGGGTLPAELFDNATVYERVLRFSGFLWDVKDSSEPVGPGPNHFSGDPRDVWVDGNGRLHLKVVARNGTWYSTEIVSRETVGYGTYIFKTTGAIDELDENMILGLFTWDNDAPAEHYREIDVEYARWGNLADPTNAQFVIQPWDTPGNLLRFQANLSGETATHAFAWHQDFVQFSSGNGHDYPIQVNDLFASWTYTNTNGIPADGPANARINLWLMNGNAPANGQPAEIIIDAFAYLPWQTIYLPIMQAE